MSDRQHKLKTERAAALAGELRNVVGKLKRKMREQTGPGNLTPSQTSVLLRLEKDGPMTVSHLARAEAMRAQSMGAIVVSLKAIGFVSASPDPQDGRQSLLSLTEACQKMIRDGRSARQDWLTRSIQAKLSAPEQETVAAGVALLARLLED